jgi:SAM-dependent methyltransferase
LSKILPMKLTKVADYYSRKLTEHGQTPQGVDWNGEESQILRFQQLTKIIKLNHLRNASSNEFSVNDLGCGYGALFNYLQNNYINFSYTGIDISYDMIRAAQNSFRDERKARFLLANQPDKIADYGIASGIFNVRLRYSDKLWRHHIEATLDILNKTSFRGFSFNCLTIYSDTEKMCDYLYYADPCLLFDICKRKYSSNVALLHDYGLYEFTILVRKKL